MNLVPIKIQNYITKTKQIFKLIDSINFSEDNSIAHIKLSKDIVIENEGNTLVLTKGKHITIANQIHLNPKINTVQNIVNKDILSLT